MKNIIFVLSLMLLSITGCDSSDVNGDGKGVKSSECDDLRGEWVYNSNLISSKIIFDGCKFVSYLESNNGIFIVSNNMVKDGKIVVRRTYNGQEVALEVDKFIQNNIKIERIITDTNTLNVENNKINNNFWVLGEKKDISNIYTDEDKNDLKGIYLIEGNKLYMDISPGYSNLPPDRLPDQYRLKK